MFRHQYFAEEHPLKEELKKRKIRLWMIRKALKGRPSEFLLSRYLSGVQPMPSYIERKIMEVIMAVDATDEQLFAEEVNAVIENEETAGKSNFLKDKTLERNSSEIGESHV